MSSNHIGAGVAAIAQDHFEFADFPVHERYSTQWNNTVTIDSVDQPQQAYQSFPSTFPSYSHSYHQHNGPSQPQYQPPVAPSCYQPNTVPGGAYHQYPAQSHNFPSYSAYHTTPTPNQYRSGYAQEYQNFGDTSAFAPRPYEESPMQRMQQLTQQQYGGPLAAQSAAAAAADAAQAARRISPPRRKRSGGEETVRDVLHRQYIEQKRLKEIQMQQMQQQQLLQQGVPIAQPAPSFFPSESRQPSINGSLTSVPPSDPPTQATPTFPFVTSTPLHSRTPPPSIDDSSSLATSTLRPGPDVSQQAMVERLKQSQMTSHHHRANAVATEASNGRSPAATVVQSERAILPPLLSSSSRKRPLEETSEGDLSEPSLKPGMRREINEKGGAVDRLYVLVHHCNQNDPDYNADGILMPYDEYKKEKKREDMITFSYSSVATPYEYVDFRVKKQDEAQAARDAVSQP